MGRFLTKDTWSGNYQDPLSLNAWNYTSSNPINYTDPSGHFGEACVSSSSSGCGWQIVWNGWIPWLVYIPCDNQNPFQLPINATPTATPQPATATPGPQYETVTAYRGYKKTGGSDLRPRIDPPEKELAELGAIGSFSVYEEIPSIYGFTYQLPFEITYKTPKQQGRIGTVVGVVSGEQIFSGGIAVYSPQSGDGHWSITIIGLSKDELVNKVVEYGKKYFGK